MEETKRKFPSLPPNYVSLQQLQEQRLRKQQQKKEEEEQRLKEEKEKQQQQQQQKEAEEEEKKKKLQVSQKTPPRIKSYDQTSSNRNGRNFSQKSWLIKEKNEAAAAAVVINPDQKLLEEEVEPKRQKSWLIKKKNEAAVEPTSQKKKRKNKNKRNATSEIQKADAEINVVAVEAEELPDLDHQNLKEIEETKKKKKRYNKGKKPMVVEEETLIEEDMKESLPPATIPNENDADVKNTRTGFRRRYQKPPPESGNQTIEIEQNIGDLKICDDDDEKKSTVEKKKNDDYYSGVMRSRKMMINRRKPTMMINRRKPMDGNLMWIRKDEKTDGFPVRSAGNFENRF